MNSREINRRTLLALAGAGVLGSRLHAAQSQLRRIRNGYATAPQFFAPGDYQLIETLTEMIIPTDDHSPGARKAGVPAYIDLVIANSSGEVRANWDHGLRAFDSAVQRYAGARFLVAAPDARAAALARIIDQRNEGEHPDHNDAPPIDRLLQVLTPIVHLVEGRCPSGESAVKATSGVISFSP